MHILYSHRDIYVHIFPIITLNREFEVYCIMPGG